MAILALDLGENRIGLAVNLVGTVVTELPTISYESAAAAVSTIALLAQERDIQTVVIGRPRLGSPLEPLVQLLADRLGGLSIIQLDETLTTKEAERLANGVPADTDAVAARLLLEQYLATREQV